MSLLNLKFTDENSVPYIWIVIVFMFVVFIGAIWSCHIKINSAEKTFSNNIQSVRVKVDENTNEMTSNKNLIIESLQQSKDTEIKVEKMSTQMLVLERTAERLEKSSRSFTAGVSEVNKISENISKMLGAFGEVSGVTQENDSIDLDKTEDDICSEEITKTKKIETAPLKNEIEDEEVVEKKGKRIWWTLGIIRSKPKENLK